MNVAQLRAVKTVLEKSGIHYPNKEDKTLLAIGYTHLDADMARQLLAESVRSIGSALPLESVAMWHWFRHSKDKKQAKDFLATLYPAVLARHRDLYDLHDPLEEGLPSIGQVQDPLFLMALTWSNESLIHLGHMLGEDVLEVIQWHEITIYSMNEKLWDESCGGYLSYDLEENRFFRGDRLRRFAPLAGEIPTQDQAECMLLELERELFAGELSVWEGWLLYYGLRRYDFDELAAKLHRFLSESIASFGCFERYNSESGEPVLNDTREQSPVAAALWIDLLKCR